MVAQTHINNDKTKEKNNFYSKVLVPLFYKNLNTKRSNDLIDLKKGLFDDKIILETKVPYLNGGLFADDKFQTNILSLCFCLFFLLDNFLFNI